MFVRTAPSNDALPLAVCPLHLCCVTLLRRLNDEKQKVATTFLLIQVRQRQLIRSGTPFPPIIPLQAVNEQQRHKTWKLLFRLRLLSSFHPWNGDSCHKRPCRMFLHSGACHRLLQSPIHRLPHLHSEDYSGPHPLCLWVLRSRPSPQFQETLRFLYYRFHLHWLRQDDPGEAVFIPSHPQYQIWVLLLKIIQ